MYMYRVKTFKNTLARIKNSTKNFNLHVKRFTCTCIYCLYSGPHYPLLASLQIADDSLCLV